MKIDELLPCGCDHNVGTMGTMVRNGRFGPGHYAQDGDFLGACTNPNEATQLKVEHAVWEAKLANLEDRINALERDTASLRRHHDQQL